MADSGLQHISFISNIFKNDAQMDAIKPVIIRNDVDDFIQVDNFNIIVSSVRYTNRIRTQAKVCCQHHSDDRG